VNSRNIWLLSPYHTGSHKQWAEGYQAHSRHRVTLVTMEGSFWKWRMMGGAVELADQARRLLAEGAIPDLVLATDMVNLPAWLGLMRRDLPAATPIVLYMHENQITYPWRPGEPRDLNYGLINWQSQLAANRVIFNSRHHHDAWFDELPRLLKHFPDYNHLEQIDAVRARSCVLPVGIHCADFPPRPDDAHGAANTAPLILWNQRWEYDKRPDRFFDLLYRLRDAGFAFRLAVCGENFRKAPHEFETARNELADRIVHWGYLSSRQAYADLLAQVDLVISTADHEFFGISVLEAICAGAFPLLPARLSYPEIISSVRDEDLRAACLYRTDAELFQAAAWFLAEPRRAPRALRDAVLEQYDWPKVSARYDDLVESLLIEAVAH
jgi:glycosyltransferase involved in cell wall biosynthesis